MLELDRALAAPLAASAREWFETWQLAELATLVRVRYSARMFRSIGRCAPARRVVTLAAGVRVLPEATQRDILCHEFAHLAAYERYGHRIRPHGREWQGLMRAAGFEPRVRFDDSAAIATIHAHARLPVRYLHRCPVCGAARSSRRRMAHWRCGACYAVGRDGRLVIERLAPT